MIAIEVHTLGIILAVLVVFLSAMPKSLRRDLRLHGRATLCLFRRRHDLQEIGNFTKRGYRAIPIQQCRYCTMMVVRQSDAVRAGAKVV